MGAFTEDSLWPDFRRRKQVATPWLSLIAAGLVGVVLLLSALLPSVRTVLLWSGTNYWTFSASPWHFMIKAIITKD